MKHRILNAIKICWWVFRNPQAIHPSNLKMLSDLLALILKVSIEDRPMMTHIAYIHPETKTENQIVSIWAGAGLGASPTERIKELIRENDELKYQLAKHIGKESEK